jgi:ABC-type glycerol-3-phosphate transport system substrate-binding protein
MKALAIPALAAAFALAACGEAEAPAADEAATAEVTETTVVEPVETETVVVDDETSEGSSLTIDGGDVDATVSEDGVEAKIKVD